MADESRKRKPSLYLPTITQKTSLTSYNYQRYIQEAPYQALMGVIVDGHVPVKLPVLPRFKVRHQTGLTNRWRLPDSLYSDMLGTAQALKSVNMPFNQNLTDWITSKYPTHNPMLLMCKEMNYFNEQNWSLLLKKKITAPVTEEEER